MISSYKEIEWLINIYKDLADSSRNLSRIGFVAYLSGVIFFFILYKSDV